MNKYSTTCVFPPFLRTVIFISILLSIELAVCFVLGGFIWCYFQFVGSLKVAGLPGEPTFCCCLLSGDFYWLTTCFCQKIPHVQPLIIAQLLICVMVGESWKQKLVKCGGLQCNDLMTVLQSLPFFFLLPSELAEQVVFKKDLFLPFLLSVSGNLETYCYLSCSPLNFQG